MAPAKRGGQMGSAGRGSAHVFHRVSNPAVGLLLRSPLHPLLSGALMLITVRGKRSGREYTLPVQYARSGDVLYVVPGDSEHKTWWRNLRGGAPVRVRLRGKEVDGEGEAFVGDRDHEAVEQGLRVYLPRFPSSARLRGVTRNPDGTFDPEGLRSAAGRTVMVRVHLGNARV